jgi:RNA polymerase sigma-70 factor, ECF subfamily
MPPQDEFLIHFLKHQLDLKAFIASLVRDRQEREDVLQETALALWQTFDKYDRARPFDRWARGIAANKIKQYREKKQQNSIVFSSAVIEAVFEAYTAQECDANLEQETLGLCMEHLPNKSRNLLVLRYERNLKLNELARCVGSTKHAVHKAITRIRDKLMQCLGHRLASAPEKQS